MFSSYKLNDIIDHHYSLIYVFVSSMKPLNVFFQARLISARSLNCSVCLFWSYKTNDIFDLHYCLIYACVPSMKRQNVSLGPHNVNRTISPLLTFLFGHTYFSPLPRDLHKGKQHFADFLMQLGGRTATFVKIFFSCLVMGQLLTHDDSKNLLLRRIM